MPAGVGRGPLTATAPGGKAPAGPPGQRPPPEVRSPREWLLVRLPRPRGSWPGETGQGCRPPPPWPS
eukprot:2413950-Alexandrium_andersonii.AAC.1